MAEREKVMIIGGGARGEAIAAAYAKSDHVLEIICVPGNPTSGWNTNGKPVFTAPKRKITDLREIGELMEYFKPDLVDVTQEDAVYARVCNLARSLGIPTVGPSSEAGRIESEKAWARQFGTKIELKQPKYKIFETVKDGISYLATVAEGKFFVKASGLAAGKGALPAHSREEAERRIYELSRFGPAADKYLIEEWLHGDDGYYEEFSTFAISDGDTYKILGSAQDHKRVDEGDRGENTGGMGCSSPPYLITDEFLRGIETEIFSKTFEGLNSIGTPYRGVLYLGGMAIRQNGSLKRYVIEFNARWGDPEAQVVVPSLVGDFYELGQAVASHNLRNIEVKNDGKYRIVVIGASQGYPADYSRVKGRKIHGIDEARKLPGITIYGAGIEVINGNYYANGGRLFSVVAEGDNVIDAQQKVYAAMEQISIEDNGLHYRRDIGHRDVQRMNQKVN